MENLHLEYKTSSTLNSMEELLDQAIQSEKQLAQASSALMLGLETIASMVLEMVGIGQQPI